MKKAKLGVIIFLFLVFFLFFLHNQNFFLTKNSLNLNIIALSSLADTSAVFRDIITPGLPNLVIAAGFLLAGGLIVYIYHLFLWMKTKRTIKRLTFELDEKSGKIRELESELESYRKDPGNATFPDTVYDDPRMEDKEETQKSPATS